MQVIGRPGYHPADLLKLYLYGDLNRIRSSRRLEAETHRNLEVMWLLRGLRPDFKTITDFQRENAPAFKAAFRHFVLLCRRLDLFGRELLAVDGTRLKAVNSKECNFTREKPKTMLSNADERLADYLAKLAKADAQEGDAPTTAPHRRFNDATTTSIRAPRHESSSRVLMGRASGRAGSVRAIPVLLLGESAGACEVREQGGERAVEHPLQQRVGLGGAAV